MKNRNDASYFDNVLISHLHGWRNNFHGGKQGCTIVVGSKDNRLYAGVSVCSKNDVFNKKIGRTIATGRAVKLAKEAEYLGDWVAASIPDNTKFNYVASEIASTIADELPFKRSEEENHSGGVVRFVYVAVTPDSSELVGYKTTPPIVIKVPVRTNV